MKKVLIGVALLFATLLNGCDSTITSDTTGTPVLELIGEIDVTIGLNEEYEDPGVQLVGDFDLEITTESDLDITKYGVYSIYYSITYDEEYIYVGRRIRVVPDTEKDFNIELLSVSTDPDTLTFSVSINDSNNSLINAKAVLYYLDQKIGEFPVTNGENILEYTGLSNFTYYRLELVGSYTDNGSVYQLGEYTVGAKTTNIDPSLYPRLELVGEDTIILNVGDEYIEQGATIIGAYESEITINSTVDTSKPGTYEVIYSIIFNLATIYEHRTVIVEPSDEVDFSVDIKLVEAKGYGLVISVTIDDPNNKVFNAKGSLYLGNTLMSAYVYSDGTTMMVFDNLLSDTTYHFVLEGAYEKDGSFVSIGDYSADYKTLEVSSIKLLVLNGDSEMDVPVNSTFKDPGAIVAGDSSIEVTTVSNLVMSNVGIYTITYTAMINGVSQTVVRTVNVINPGALDFGVSLSLTSTTESSITYALVVNDQFSNLVTHTARLFKETIFVSEQEFTEGTNTLEFTGLDPDSEYYVVIDGEYMLNGFIESMGDYQLTASTLPASAPVISLISYEVGIEDMAVVINVLDEHSQIISMNVIMYNILYDYTEKTETLTIGENSILFAPLMHEVDHSLIIEYSYIPYGETQAKDVILNLLDFTTLTPPKPVLTNIESVWTDTTITCSAEWDTTGFDSGIYYFARLYHDGVFDGVFYFTNDGTSLFIDGLDPDVTYNLLILADYVVTETSTRYISEIITIEPKDFKN